MYLVDDFIHSPLGVLNVFLSHDALTQTDE